MRRLCAGAVAILTLMPLAIIGAAADGMSHVYIPETDTWNLVREDAQFAMISYVDGNENLLIQASVSAARLEAGSEAVWLFPIPANPANSEIAIVQSIDPLDGYFIDELAEDAVNDQFIWVYGTQLYPLALMGFTWGLFSVAEMGSTGPDYKDLSSSGATDGVDVSGHVEAFGLASEFVSANESEAVDAYLAGKGMNLSGDSLALLDEYIGQDYSFVVSWVNDVDEFTSMSQPVYGNTGLVYKLGVCVTFPTERMYYPLKLTSVYGQNEIPVVIEVVGTGTPVEFEDEREQDQVEFHHCIDRSYDISPLNSWFFASELSAGALGSGSQTLTDLEFTIIRMDGRASDLTEDLWIEQGVDSSGATANFVYHNSWAVAVPALVASSVLASLCSGLVIYWSFKPDLKLFAALGLANILTIGGVIVASTVFDIDKNFVDPALAKPGYRGRRPFLILFTLLFLGFASLSHGIVLYAL